MLPTPEQCYALWDKYEMPANIRAHTRAVARVADLVALHIASQGIAVDKELVNRGALLHDIAKLRGIQGGKEVRHTDEGAEIVMLEGFGKRLADIVRRHGTGTFSFNLPIEDQIVNYADRRVLHDKIVSLPERLADLAKRYPGAREIIEESRPLYEEFEKMYNLGLLPFDKF
ncbi:MAG: HDIG domain-containing protein [Candidatus Jacksonbacteria bacterium]|nr:HDIG domain-containing protein [Candidatus Jacksonbacteria bacterium]